jgi:hypothetical protein
MVVCNAEEGAFEEMEIGSSRRRRSSASTLTGRLWKRRKTAGL